MATIDERRILEIAHKSQVELTDQFVIEDEDGTKLADVGGLKKLISNNLTFNTLEDLKSSSFKEGEIINTLGYNRVGDGGAATYVITYAPELAEDKANVHYLHTSDTLRAQFVFEDHVSPEQFGARGDGIRDDYDAIVKCINTKYPIHFIKNHKYRISSAIILEDNLYLDFNGSTLIPNYCNGFSLGYDAKRKPLENVTIKNIKVDMINGTSVISLKHPAKHFTLEDFHIFNLTLNGISIIQSRDFKITNGQIECVNATANSKAIEIWHDNTVIQANSNINDYRIENVYFKNTLNAISCTAKNDKNITAVSCKNCQYEFDENTINSGKSEFLIISSGNFNVSVERLTASGCETVFTFSPNKGDLNIRDIITWNCGSLVVNTKAGTQIFTGDNILMDGVDSAIRKPMFKLLAGILIRKNHYISHNPNRHVIKTNIDANYSGELRDIADPQFHPRQTYTGTGGIIELSDLRNRFLNVQLTSDITEIRGGVNGQRLCLVSSTNRKIIANADIVLKATQVQLTLYEGVELKRMNGRWYQI